jgi:hypothetical protein
LASLGSGGAGVDLISCVSGQVIVKRFDFIIGDATTPHVGRRFFPLLSGILWEICFRLPKSNQENAST